MKEILTTFEAELDPRRPHARVIGYGEISTVFALDALPGVVLKRMAGFRTEAEVDAYRAVVDRYCALLRARGVAVVETSTVAVEADRRRTVYVVQPCLPAATIGNAVLRDAADDELRRFVRAVLDRLSAVWTQNGDGLALGLDAQLSNWAWQDGRATLLDVSTPILRDAGREQMDPKIVLRSMPRPIAWAFRHVALPSLLERYHNARPVAVDLAANAIKEGAAERLPLLLEEINAWLPGEPLTEREVRKAYAADARLWVAFQAVRKLDRALTHAFGGRYDYVLPGAIVR